MKLVVGLGNPGIDYELTRHNVGFMLIDYFCKINSVSLSNKKFNSFFTKTNLFGEEVLICKPLTYMNNSGVCVREVMNFYKIEPKDIIVVVDDLNIRVGALRYRVSGSSGGQNGLKNIIEQIGTENFRRVRVGISKPENSNYPIHDYVMSKFSKEEWENLSLSIPKTSKLIEDFIKGVDDEKLMSLYNSK